MCDILARMRATLLYAPGDIRVEEVPDPVLSADHEAIVRVVASCVCGSDLWPYRGIDTRTPLPRRIGHEFIGVVEQVGTGVSQVSVGDFVIAPFFYSCGECENCQFGVSSACVRGGAYDGCQAELVSVPQADGTLYRLPSRPNEEQFSDLLALSDVFPTGHHAAVSARVQAGGSAVVVGDGAVGLSGVLAAKRLGANTIVAMSRHDERAALAKRFGATHIVSERGKDGAAQVKEIVGEIGADAVLECVGTEESMKQAFMSLRPGGTVGYVGVPHTAKVNLMVLFGKNMGLMGGVAPVRSYLDELVPEVLAGNLRPGAVFDQTLPLSYAASAYRAMDERTAIKVMLRP